MVPFTEQAESWWWDGGLHHKSCFYHVKLVTLTDIPNTNVKWAVGLNKTRTTERELGSLVFSVKELPAEPEGTPGENGLGNP